MAIQVFYTGWQTDIVVPGLEMAPKTSTIILNKELGNP